MFLDISEVAQRSGMAASTLRYYEKRALIEALARKGIRRQFEASVLDRLAIIRLAQTAGFSLDEIQEMLPGTGPIDLSRDKLRGRADEIDAQIAELTRLSALLRHIAKCSAPHHSTCPKFRKLLDNPKQAVDGAE